MKIEKKLVASSILALLIGVSSVVPLLFLMSGTAKAETGSEPQFNVEVPYAYICSGTSSVPSTPKSQDMIEIQTVSLSIVLDFTLIADAEAALCDAQIEYYRIDIYSDKGYIGNETGYVGTRYNSAFELPHFFFSRDNWFDANISSGAGGMFYYPWAVDESQMMGTVSSGTNWVPTFGEPETIFISVRRLGWITFKGNSTVVTLANGEEVAKVQLEKYGNGFLYNNLVPEDQLSQIDMLNPPFWDIAK